MAAPNNSKSSINKPIIINSNEPPSQEHPSRLERIDNGLKQCYRILGIANYTDNDGVGKFMKFCIESEFVDDQESVSEELDDVSASEFPEFDEEFLKDKYDNDDDRKSEVFKIIKYCYHYGKPPPFLISDNDEKKSNDTTIIDQIDNTLHLYYEKMDRDDYIVTNDKKGKFYVWFNEQPMYTTIDLQKAFEDNKYDACDFSAIDDEFPFLYVPTLKNKQKKLFKVIQHCSVSNKPPYLGGLKGIRLSLKAPELAECKRDYAKQCPKIFGTKAESDEAFNYGLAIGRSNHNYPFMKYLCDVFVREKIAVELACKFEKGGPTVDEWALKNAFIQDIKADTKHPIKSNIIGALKSYQLRVCPQFSFDRMTFLIADKVRDIVQIVVMASHLMHHVVTDSKNIINSANPPFQLNLSIAVRDVLTKDTTNDSENLIHDCLAGLDLDEDEYEQKKEEYKDEIGDLESRFKKSVFMNYNEWNYKTLPAAYNQYNRKYMKHSNANLHKRRLNVLVDRRQCVLEEKLQTPNHGIYIFELDEDMKCNKLPQHNHCPEWYFDSVVKCIIPPPSSKSKGNGVTGGSRGSGLLTFSFHVEEDDQISCYMYWNTMCLRFLAQDIIDILPNICVRDGKWVENAKFLDDKKDAVSFANEFDESTRNLQFETFWKEATGKPTKFIREYLKPTHQ